MASYIVPCFMVVEAETRYEADNVAADALIDINREHQTRINLDEGLQSVKLPGDHKDPHTFRHYYQPPKGVGPAVGNGK